MRRWVRLKEPDLRSRLGSIGVKKMHTEFSANRTVDVLLEDYSSALRGPLSENFKSIDGGAPLGDQESEVEQSS